MEQSYFDECLEFISASVSHASQTELSEELFRDTQLMTWTSERLKVWDYRCL